MQTLHDDGGRVAARRLQSGRLQPCVPQVLGVASTSMHRCSMIGDWPVTVDDLSEGVSGGGYCWIA